MREWVLGELLRERKGILEGSISDVIAKEGAVFLGVSSVKDEAVVRGRFSSDIGEEVEKGGNRSAA